VAQFDLTLALQETGDEIAGVMNYSSDLFDETTIARWAGYLRRVYEQIGEDASRDLKGISLLDEQERAKLLRGFNATEKPYPRDTLIHELFEGQVLRTPNAIAVMDDDEQLTYAELNGKANQLARYLRSHGVGRNAQTNALDNQRTAADQLVGICLERGVGMVLGLLGVLKAGAAYVPLDPNYPSERLQYMLGDAAPQAVVTQASLRHRVPASAARTVCLDTDWSAIAEHPESNLSAAEVGLESQHLAYVIYTSGSTGEPKGVMIEHRNTANLLHWARDSLERQAFARTLASTSLNFDLAVYECFVPLTVGGCVRVRGNALGVERTDELTLINTVPSAMSGLLDRDEVPPGTQVINLAGEALRRTLVERIFAQTQVERVCNLYGPSETTTYSTWVLMSRDAGFNSSIGRPIANTVVYILDGRGEPAPIGVSGEIYIGGAGVARGYWHRAQLTRERFVKDPFSVAPDARMYKTGDVGRWLADGTIEYLGRNDHQVKLRGFRIELGEIESRLGQHERVHSCVVVAREDEPGEKRLVAYYTTALPTVGDMDGGLPPGKLHGTPSAEDLREHLRRQLPEYMVPSAFVLLQQLPLTANGKVDRRSLPAPGVDAYGRREYEAPQGVIETTLAQIWCELLKVDRVGRADNFFALGGHSLLTVQMIQRLRQKGLRGAVQNVFKAATLQELASTLERVGSEFIAPDNLIPADSGVIEPGMLPLVDLTPKQIEAIVRRVPGGARNIQDIYPLAPLQEGILFHHRLDAGRDPYVMPVLLELSSRKKLDRLLSAFQGVIDRHDILRTAVIWKGLEKPVQVVYRKVLLPLQELPAHADVLSELRGRMAPGQIPMDLEKAPLLRIQVAKEGIHRKWYALILLHHLAIDHVSLEQLLQEAGAHMAGRAHELPKPVPYREYVAQALARARSGEGDTFFRRELGSVREPTAPFGLLNVHGDGTETAEAQQAVEPELAARIRRCARRLGVSAATLFHVAYALVVARTSTREEVVFGSVLSGRLQGTVGADRALGMFINTLPLRVDLQGRSVEEVVQGTRELLGELVKHEQLPLIQAQRMSAVEGSLPLFSAVLNYRHNEAGQDKNKDEGRGIRVLAVHERTNYPFLVSVDDFGERFGLTALTDHRIDPHRVTRYVRQAMDSLVRSLEEAPHTPALQIQILPEGEREQLLRGFNATQEYYSQESLIHELFEAQVRRTPQAIAVVCDDERLTYAELNSKANQLARYLRAQGVEADQLVGICIERDVGMVVGLLGILKAGAAYVPLDPSYPSERLQYMLEDAAPRAIVTQSSLRAIIPGDSIRAICLDGDWAEIAQQPAGNLDAEEVGVTAGHLAYLIYTSGSTGKPKGVMIEHRNTANLLYWARESLEWQVFAQTLASTSLNFDLAVYECFVPLSVGGSVRVRSNALQVECTDELTLINTVPSAMTGLLDRGSVPLSTRVVNLAGEALKRALVERIFAETQVERVCNLYGPSETTTYSTWVPMSREAGFNSSIGWPIAN
ncbi:MAG TPA: amino acid adenylation domain-containing protein, partial [Steroidobacteraceae bacterium]